MYSNLQKCVKGFRPPHPAWGSRHQQVWKADQAAEQSVLLNAEEPISKAQGSPTKSPEQRLNKCYDINEVYFHCIKNTFYS